MIILPFKITRKFIQAHPDWLFIYSIDASEKGMLGQMWHAHGEPNAYPVPVMLKICLSNPDKYFSDTDFDYYRKTVDEYLDRIPLNTGKPILPFRKIGEGYSEMKTRAPRLHKYLIDRINAIKTEHEIDYKGLYYPLYPAYQDL